MVEYSTLLAINLQNAPHERVPFYAYSTIYQTDGDSAPARKGHLFNEIDGQKGLGITGPSFSPRVLREPHLRLSCHQPADAETMRDARLFFLERARCLITQRLH